MPSNTRPCMKLPSSAFLTTSGEKHPWLPLCCALARMPLRKSCGTGSIPGWRLAISASTGLSSWPTFRETRRVRRSNGRCGSPIGLVANGKYDMHRKSGTNLPNQGGPSMSALPGHFKPQLCSAIASAWASMCKDLFVQVTVVIHLIDSASPDPRLAAANWPACLSLWRPLMGVFGSPKITASSSQESLATRYLPNRAVAQDQGLQECEGVYQANIKCQCSFRHQASMDSRHKILFGVR